MRGAEVADRAKTVRYVVDLAALLTARRGAITLARHGEVPRHLRLWRAWMSRRRLLTGTV